MMQKNLYEFNFIDGMIIKGDKELITYEPECIECGFNSKRGFMIRKAPHKFQQNRFLNKIGYMCIDCFCNIIENEMGLKSEDVVFLDIEVANKYGYYYSQYKKERIGEESFKKVKKEFSCYIPNYFIRAIELLIDADIEHGKHEKGDTSWDGYWKRYSGYDFRSCLNLLKEAMKNNKHPNDLKKSKNDLFYMKVTSDLYEKKFKRIN